MNIEAVADMLMRRQGRAYIYPGERTGSVYIYPKTNTFYDFGRAVGGDVIRLWSHIKGCNSWTALKEMGDLPDNPSVGDFYSVKNLDGKVKTVYFAHGWQELGREV